MGFNKQDLDPTYQTIRSIMTEIRSPYNDGFTSSSCKQDLYMLKCWLENEYNNLPTFVGEKLWEQNRILDILKK
jgi:hypothetical protein